MEAEMRAAGASSASAPSLADAARELLSIAAGASGASTGSISVAGEKGTADVARLVWEKAGTMAQTSLWAATFGQGLGGVVRTAEELEKLTKPLGGLTVVGFAFSLVALSARVVGLMGMEREGRDRLAQAREDLRDASVSLLSWLLTILGSGFNDEDGLVGKVFDVLGECWDGADELEQYLLRRWAFRVWNAEDIGVVVGKVEAVTGKLLATGLLNLAAKHERRIGDLEDKAFVADDFRPYAPPVSFDVGLLSNAATGLAQLKAVVLPTEPEEGSTGVYDSNEQASGSSLRHVALTSVNGEGGVGKTSTCRLLCVDEDIHAFFSEGAILFMDVGQGASEEKVMNEVRKAVSKCGGKRAAEEIRSSSDIFEAVDIAREFFSGRIIFIVLDNVWETPVGSKVASWAVALSKIASFPGSAVIMTTRSALLPESSGFDHVHLGRLDLMIEGGTDWRIAEQLYDALLGATPEERLAKSYLKDRKKALSLTCGLPLGIATFTGVVRSRLRVGGDASSVLAKIENRAIGLAGKFVGEDMSAATRHPGLFAAMEESLAFLDEQKGCRVKSVPLAVRKDADGENTRIFSASYGRLSDRPLSSRYTALEAMAVSSAGISFQVLCRLWHLRNAEEAEEIALLFVNVGLGRIGKDSLGQDGVLSLHDLQYEFCAGMRDASLDATGNSGSASLSSLSGHALLFSACESLLNPEQDEDEIGMGWASFCFAEVQGLSEPILRQYLTQNLFRHLCAAVVVMEDADGVRRTIYNILSDFRWLRGRVAGHGSDSAVSDCLLALAVRCGAGPRLLTGGAETAIRALRETLMLVGDCVPRESDGTLAGALVQLTQSSVDSGDAGMDDVFYRQLACSAEKNVHGAWLAPISECSRAQRGQGVLDQAVVGSGSCVWSLSALGDGAHCVSGSEDGAVRVHERDSLAAVLELKEHTNEVKCVGVSKDDEGSFLLFSGSADGTVRSCQVALDPVRGVVQNGTVLVGDCESGVLCLSVSTGGHLVAAGCENGTVFLWMRQDGDAALRFWLVTSFRCSKAEGELGSVNGMAVSGSGDLVLAGDQKGNIAFWSSGGSGMEGSVIRCRASDESDANLRCVLLLEDGYSASLVFDEPVGFEIWDVVSRRRCSPRVGLPDFYFLACATFVGWPEACAERSGTRGVLVAGGWDEGVGDFISLHSPSDDFKVLSTFPVSSTPRSVCCTSFGGSKVILVGSDDGCVRVLDADGPITSHGTESDGEGARWLGSGLNKASDGPDLSELWTVAVMANAGLIVAGHEDGRFSLWRAEDGEFIRSFDEDKGDSVYCVDLSADERLSVSGHQNGLALVWDSTTWECRFALEVHAEPVICSTISADASRIVTVDEEGELRFWNAQSGGAAMLTIETGFKFLAFGFRGAISLDGGLFLWAGRDRRDRKWRGYVIDFGLGRVILRSEESCHLNWNAFLEGMMSSESLDVKEDVRWRYGAVYWNRFVEMSDLSSSQQPKDM